VAKLKLSESRSPFEREREPVLSVRFIVALVLIALGIAWIAYYYLGVHPSDHSYSHPESDFRGLTPLRHLKDWNYLIGFALLFAGLVVAAHPSTPLGRGRGVATAMVACFVIGLLWICLYYIFSGQSYFAKIPVFNDLDQKNLLVGIAWMAVGFAYATRWE
jgi:fatty acid desaturase